MQLYYSHMPMTQASLTVQPKKLLSISDWNCWKLKLSSRTQHKDTHKDGSKEHVELTDSTDSLMLGMLS